MIKNVKSVFVKLNQYLKTGARNKVVVIVSRFMACLFIMHSFIGLVNAKTEKNTSIAHELGWVPNTLNLCKGSYRDLLQAYHNPLLPNIKNASTHIDAERSHFALEGTSKLSGHVVIKQPGRMLYADTVYIYRDPDSGNITNLDLRGKVKIYNPNFLLIAKKAHLNVNKQSGSITDIIYRNLLNPNTKTNDTSKKQPINAWGTASHAEQTRPGLITLHNANYTTCSPVKPSWQLHAKKIVLNHDTGRGKAYNTWLNYGGVPIFYSPYLGFPLDDRRQSGFLFPYVNTSTRSGLSFGFPYYWNMATNYDFLFTPTLMTKRGLQLEGRLRYLTHQGNGTLTATYLFHDHATTAFADRILSHYPHVNRLFSPTKNPAKNRRALSWQDQHHWSPRWSSAIDINWVDDDYYLEDFNKPITAVTNQLTQSAEINYFGDIWNFKTRVLHYQTLHPLNQTVIDNPYNSLPEIDVTRSPQTFHGFNYGINNQFIYFQITNNPGQRSSLPQGLRIHVQPFVSYPIKKRSYSFVPRMQLSLTHYRIRYPSPGFESSIQRVVPLFSIDSRLYFDRVITMGTTYKQTLEPRLLYLYVPYRNQNNIPVFDSALIPFSYDSLFSTNRFSGYDRIGDANQIGFGLTTRFLNHATGEEKFRASIGEIYYFQNRRVNLCNTVQNPRGTTQAFCANPVIEDPSSPTEKFSPLTGQLNYNLSSTWSTTTDIAWDLSHQEIINAVANVQYHPYPNQLFNINYGRIRFAELFETHSSPRVGSQNDFNRLGFSFATPLKNQWSTVGGWNYDVSHRYSQSFFYGLQYDNCCWALRIVAGRNFSHLNQNNNPVFNNLFYLQWQFKGLSTLSNSDITGFLTQNIPGYIDNF